MARRKGLQRIDVWVSIIAVLITAFAVIKFLGNKPAWTPVVQALWAGWALVPPAWFLIEWSLYDKEKHEDPDFSRLKYNHELASKFWVAGVTVLSAILLAEGGVILR